MFSYSVCGLGIRSVVPLPELVETTADADLEIHWGEAGTLAPGAHGNEDSGVVANGSEVCLFWREIGAFVVRGGNEIFVYPAPGVSQQVLRLFLLGRVLGTLLHQRGLLVLHASAVSVGGTAIAFLGGKGWGKSTLAGALYEQGHSIVADDIVAISSDLGVAKVFPGFPQLKLWPEAATFLGHSVDSLPLLHPQYEKRACSTSRGFSLEPLPLGAIYVLDEADQLEVSTLCPKEAFIELVRHSYVANLLELTGTSAHHFRCCVDLTRSLSIRRLRKTSSLAELPRVTKFLTEQNNTRWASSITARSDAATGC